MDFVYTHCDHVVMRRQAGSVQYTIRGVSPEVDRLLRKKAVRTGKSLNQVALEELAAATMGSRGRVDLSDVTGKWTPDPAFDEILAGQRQIDWDKWRCGSPWIH
jgi:hypothetical protein